MALVGWLVWWFESNCFVWFFSFFCWGRHCWRGWTRRIGYKSWRRWTTSGNLLSSIPSCCCPHCELKLATLTTAANDSVGCAVVAGAGWNRNLCHICWNDKCGQGGPFVVIGSGKLVSGEYHLKLALCDRDKVVALVIKSLKNPRSALCKTAIMVTADMFKAYQDRLVDSLDPLVLAFILTNASLVHSL